MGMISSGGRRDSPAVQTATRICSTTSHPHQLPFLDDHGAVRRAHVPVPVALLDLGRDLDVDPRRRAFRELRFHTKVADVSVHPSGYELQGRYLRHVVPLGSGEALCMRDEVALGCRVCPEDLDAAPREELSRIETVREQKVRQVGRRRFMVRLTRRER